MLPHMMRTGRREPNLIDCTVARMKCGNGLDSGTIAPDCTRATSAEVPA
jgi:hypothetical protein